MKRNTPEHPKLKELAHTLRINHGWAVGLLELLFHATGQYAPMGNIGKWPDQWIADALYWKRPAEQLITALVDSGWLDRDPEFRLLVHNWQDHCDQTVRKFLSRGNLDFAKPSLEHTLYFIRATSTGAIKMGVTGRPIEFRLAELRKGTMEHLEVIGTLPGGYRLENELRSTFGHLWIKGEWYKSDDAMLMKIQELTKNMSGHCPARWNQTASSLTDTDTDTKPSPLPPSGEFVLEPSGANGHHPTKPKPRRAKFELTGDQGQWFEEFWSLYWRRDAKLAAEESFGRTVTTVREFEAVKGGILRQTPEMLTRELRHRPQAATWLNQKRWGDECDGPPQIEAQKHPDFLPNY